MVRKKNKEIFIDDEQNNSDDTLDEDQDITNEVYNEELTSILPDEEKPPTPEPPDPNKKKKKVYKRDPATVERLKEQLKKGRAKGLETRRRNAELRKLKKLESMEENENKLYEKLKLKQEGKKNKDILINENNELRKKLEEMKKIKLELEEMKNSTNEQVMNISNESIKTIPKTIKKDVLKGNTKKNKLIQVLETPVIIEDEKKYSLMDAFNDLRKIK